MNNNVYLVFTKTNTKTSKVIHFFTKKPYNHCSISSDINLNHMYSFCRTFSRALPATFNQEVLTVNKGRFGPSYFTPCEIYELNLTDEQRQIYDNIIRHFIENRSKYSFNIIGFGTILLNIDVKREYKYVCSQFVAHVLHKMGFVLPKSTTLSTPDDLRNLPYLKMIYRGDVNTYFNDVNGNKNPNYNFQ